MSILGGVSIGSGFKSIEISKNTIDQYEVLDGQTKKSTGSALGRGLVGGFLLGPLGMIAGAATPKTKGVYLVAVHFKSGQNSLLEVDEKIYKNILKVLF